MLSPTKRTVPDINAKQTALGNEVVQWFELFDNIVKPERYAEKKKVKNKVYKGNVRQFVEQMEGVMKKAAELLRGKNLRWAEIFHLRMRIRKDLLSGERLMRYEEMVKLYLKKVAGSGGGSGGKSTINMPQYEAAISLEGFVATHRVDPDSSLVGLSPAAPLLARYVYRLENPTTSGEVEAETTREALARSILTWAKLDDPARVIAEVRRVASLLETVPPTDITRFKVGDIVVVGAAAGTIYGRFAGRKEGDKVAVWTLPDEKIEEVVPAVRVFPLMNDMAVNVQGGASMMRGLVEDPTRELTMRLNSAIKSRTMGFLIDQELDANLLERAQRKEVTILDLPHLKKSQSLLLSFLANPPVEFLKAIDEYAQGEVCSFIAGLSPLDLFHPTRDEQLRLLCTVRWDELPALRVQRLLSYHKEALTHLQLQKKELMNGTTKDRTTAWWLSLIRSECEKFLARKGYNFHAVPDDYLEKPPTDFPAVKRNLTLIREILNPTEDKHQVQRLIKRLKETIYPEIDRFISNARIVLAEQFGLDYKQFALEEAEAKFNAEKDNMDAEVVDWIGDMFQDIRYLMEMKRLESPQEGQEKNLDIVPVTGLIVGRFYRIENELRTVIDHWGDMFPAEEATQEAQAILPRNGDDIIAKEGGEKETNDNEPARTETQSNETGMSWVESPSRYKGRTLTDSFKSSRSVVIANSNDGKTSGSAIRTKPRASSTENIGT